MTDDERREAGERTRRAVLGDAHVDRAKTATTPFSADWQDFITRVAWGDVWTRPGLSRATRRLLVLTATIALGREEEFKLHVRAALADGIAPDTVKEVILQAAIYCGLPAANAAMQWTADVLEG